MTDALLTPLPTPALRTSPAHVSVEGSARVLRGLAVTYGEPTLVAEPGPDGRLIVIRERFDSDSIIIPERQLPLLQGHDATRPIGRVTTMWHGTKGLEVEAELIGSSLELDGLRERIGAGVLSGLSIAFAANPKLDKWSKPNGRNVVPEVLRRGATLREVSLVLWPAYPGARVTAVRNRTERQLWSDQVLAEARERRQAREAEARAEADRRRAEVDLFLAEEAVRRIVRQQPVVTATIPEAVPPRAHHDDESSPLDRLLREIGDPPPKPGPDADDDAWYNYNIRSDEWNARMRDASRLLDR